MADQVGVAWQSAELQSSEQCTIQALPGPGAVVGTVTLLCHGVPPRIDYRITTDAGWATRTVDITLYGGVSREIRLERGDDGWTVNGRVRPDLNACIDVDLGWTPATNVLPLRRVPVAVGDSLTTSAAWVRFPALDVVASEQTYTRLTADRVRYQSATFEAELVVTPDGIVTTYGDELWVATSLDRF